MAVPGPVLVVRGGREVPTDLFDVGIAVVVAVAVAVARGRCQAAAGFVVFGVIRMVFVV